jgi:hypothetical protein
MYNGKEAYSCSVKAVFLGFVYRLYFNKITFRKLDLLSSSGRTETLAAGPPGSASLRSFYLKIEEDPAS